MRRCVDVYMYGLLDVWMCGCLDVWMSGCVEVQMSRFLDVYSWQSEINKEIIVSLLARAGCGPVIDASAGAWGPGCGLGS